MLHKSQLLALDRPTPRYTSYPPATQFKEEDSSDLRRQALSTLPSNERLSLYLHIPFCQQLCYYCGCFTTATKKQDRIARYVELLKKEMALVRKFTPNMATVGHIHFGGGSPSILSPKLFSELMQHLHYHFDIETSPEIAIEADPRQLTEAKIASYAQHGLNRISLGVQDFHHPTLKAINREQGAALTYQSVRWARQYGIEHINFDLMYGLPHQNTNSMIETMQLATALAPSRIAFFGYAHVPWMKKHMQAIDMAALPDASLRYDLFQTGYQFLTQANYQSIGIDHFVCTDDAMHHAYIKHQLKRNFQGYTTDAMHSLIGFGASAISKMPFGYIQNKADITAYEQALAGNKLPPIRSMPIHLADETRAHIIESLMCYFAVDLTRYSEQPAQEFAQSLERLKPMLEQELVSYQNHQIRILKQPQLIARMVAAAFDAYTPWPEESNRSSARHAPAI